MLIFNQFLKFHSSKWSKACWFRFWRFLNIYELKLSGKFIIKNYILFFWKELIVSKFEILFEFKSFLSYSLDYCRDILVLIHNSVWSINVFNFWISGLWLKTTESRQKSELYFKIYAVDIYLFPGDDFLDEQNVKI